jgi:predicted Zn-dependent peptidase
MQFDRTFYSDYIRETVYYKKLNSGLDVYILPKKSFAKKYAFFATRYGGLDNHFRIEGRDDIKMPLGIAHFLEHQVFEEEDESNFERFEKIGANVNAYTSYGTTVYHFDTVDAFDDGLKYLMDMVQNTAISDSSVEKEKKVIEQEIRMYYDEPEWLLSSGLMKSLYHKHPIREDIAGSVESVQSITREAVLDCYRYFYNPDNMALFVYGDVDSEKVLEQIDSYQTDAFKSNRFSPKILLPEEPYAVAQKRLMIERPIGKDQMLIGFKSKPMDHLPDRELRMVALRVANDMMFGRSSDHFDRCYSKGLINDGFDFELQAQKGYAYVLVGNETEDVEQLYAETIETLRRHLKDGFDKTAFLRMKKKLLGRMITSFNALQSIANNYTYSMMRGTDLFEQVAAYNTLTYEMLHTAVRDFYDADNHSLSALVNKK